MQLEGHEVCALIMGEAGLGDEDELANTFRDCWVRSRRERQGWSASLAAGASRSREGSSRSLQRREIEDPGPRCKHTGYIAGAPA